MKKINYFMLACCIVASCIFVVPAEAKGKRRDVDIKLVHFPKRHVFRSDAPLIEAIYEDDEMLHVEFNQNFGRVTILIQDSMQQVVAKYECDTDMEPYVVFPVSLDEMDTYTVRILGNSLEAIGYIN